jgi:DNA-directed RNA polymerase subunit alpha
MKHFCLGANIGELSREEVGDVEEAIPPRIYDMPIEELALSVRAYNCLKRAGITKVGMILEKLEKGEDEILAIRNFGRKSLEELQDALEEKNLLPLPEEEGSDET